MKVELLDSFIEQLSRQVNYISADKPQAARKFKNNLLKQVRSLKSHPFKFRKSIYANDRCVRDMPYKGYTVVYRIDEGNKTIAVFALLKQQSAPEELP